MGNEASAATTRQFAQEQQASPYDASYQSQLAQLAQLARGRIAPENRSGGQSPGAPSAAPFYNNQMSPQIPNYPDNNYPANYHQAARKKPGALKWILLALSCVVLVSGAISAMVISVIRSQPLAPAETGRARQMETPPPQKAPSPPSVPGASTEQYKYPNVNLAYTVRASRSESQVMTTSDSVSVVTDYYKKRLGNPMVKRADQTAVFRIPGPPMIEITINQDKQDSSKTQIMVTRTR
ncbi:MAG TPA: hypothetical protein VI479_03660 [Blastocatellia bacterium]